MDKTNLTFMTCRDFQQYMNSKQVEFGQPYINESKGSRLLSLEERSELIVYANPKLKGFRPDMERMFIPKGLDQVLDFFASKEIFKSITIDKQKRYCEVVDPKTNKFNNWKLFAAYLIQKYKAKGDIN